MKHFISALALFVAPFILSACMGQAANPDASKRNNELRFSATQTPSEEYELGDFIIEWNPENGGQLSVKAKNRSDFVLWQSVPGIGFVAAADGQETVTENRGMFEINDQLLDTCNTQRITNIGRGNIANSIEIKGTLLCGSGKEVPYSIDLNSYQNEPDILEMSLAVESNRAFLIYQTTPDEHFFGFGEQFTYFDMKGQRVPIWVSEQGVGRGEQPLTFFADATNNGAGGDGFTTYAPMPFYMTNQIRSLFLANDGYTSFDLHDPDRVVIETFGGGINARLINGSTPTEIIQTYTASTGRMKSLPDWLYSGAVVGMQGGTEKVRDVYAKLLVRNTPVSAFWLQDWVGQRATSFGKQLWWNWEVDYQHYPGWDAMVSDLNDDGVRVMVYLNPYLVDVSEKPNANRNLFQEALENGYLIKNPQGEPYLVLNTDFQYGMVDLTNPDARQWLGDVIQKQVVGAGVSGWMADFGESLPYDAVLHDPNDSSAPYIHNRWPVTWAGFNAAIVDQNDSDLVFFSRSAYTGSAHFSPLYWEGDQMVDWSREDGIKSAVTGLNTSGLSGMAFNHSDIGGYTTISSPVKNYHRSRELLFRWMEMNAFTLTYRTHEGNQPENNVQFYTDEETLDTFAYWSKVYAALFEYRQGLVQEATETGLPVVRHPFIHYPADPEIWKITYQEFMLGRDFLIAPVTDPDTDEIEVYLPAGRWVHLWTGAVYGSEERGGYVSVAAPLGQPGVFYQEGSAAGADFVQTLSSQGLLL